jgi:GTP-binding protein HflX
VTDTVGFIRKLPHHLVASFRATLEEAREADVLLHIVDSSHPDWEGQMHVVERVLAELDLADRPLIPVFNKIDAVPDPVGFAERVKELHPDALVVTTVRTNGLAPLKATLRDLARSGRPMVRVRLPLADGARLAALYRDGEVVSREERSGEYDILVRLHRWQVERLQREGIAVVAEKAAGPAGKRAAAG